MRTTCYTRRARLVSSLKTIDRKLPCRAHTNTLHDCRTMHARVSQEGNYRELYFYFALPSLTSPAPPSISFPVFISAAMLNGASVPLLRNSSKVNTILHSAEIQRWLSTYNLAKARVQAISINSTVRNANSINNANNSTSFRTPLLLIAGYCAHLHAIVKCAHNEGRAGRETITVGRLTITIVVMSVGILYAKRSHCFGFIIGRGHVVARRVVRYSGI